MTETPDADGRVSRWLSAQLRTVRAATGNPVTIVLDPHDLVPHESLTTIAASETIADWWSLRRVWESGGRDRSWQQGRLIIHLTEAAASLPFDIERRSAVVEISSPVPLRWIPLLRTLLPEESADRLVESARKGADDRLLLESLLGTAVTLGSPSSELAAVATLRSRPALPDAVWSVMGQALSTPLARQLAQQPPDGAELAVRWRRWLTGETHDQMLEDAGPALLGLVTNGLLPSVSGIREGAPRWTRFAAADTDAAARARELLEVPPVAGVPATAAEWSSMAQWIGAARGLVAEDPTAPADLVQRLHERAIELDELFLPWLQAHYGALLQSAALPPRTVHKIAPFLAHRLSREADRVLLVVLDGVGFAQWGAIVDAVDPVRLEQHACFAMLPTETVISRQAISAGATPDTFAASFHTTAQEGRHWSRFWAQEGLSATEVRYHRVDGRLDQHIPFGPSERAVIVIISAIDKLMHDSLLLGDVQFAAGVRAWCAQGFLRTLLADASRDGFETWIASDHGNVSAGAAGVPPAGLQVQHAGTRYRLYRSLATRNAAAALGIRWTPPRLPPDVHVLFAPSRSGFHRHGERVTHGGLSIEECCVPFARVM